MVIRTRAIARALAAAAVLAVAASAAQAPGGIVAVVAAQAVGAPDRDIPIHRDGRPFRHAEHQRVRCGDCHTPDQRHRQFRGWTAADCAACHHGAEATPAGCTACHARASYEPPRRLPVDMALSVWSGPRARDLVFEHARHADVGCLDCHRAGMELPAERCESCHTQHHRPGADCTHCHVAPDPTVHDRAAHLTCGGSGCHADAATRRPMMSRTSCLVCHTEQREHRPGRDCVQCHVKPTNVNNGTERSDHGNP